MTKEITYGVISDIHNDPRIIVKALEELKEAGISKLLVNGDIGDLQETVEQSQQYIAFILDAIGKSGIEAFVQPGSHESFMAYMPVIEHFSKAYPNIIDALRTPEVQQQGHKLVFLPGSDGIARGAEFFLIDGKHKTGSFLKLIDREVPFEGFQNHTIAFSSGLVRGLVHYQDIQDLERQVSDPDHTIVICHVPRRFDNLNEAVDMAYFGMSAQGIVPGVELEAHLRQKYGTDVDVVAAAKKKGFELKTANSGNEGLKRIYEKLGINKALSGHFHESGGRANDTKGCHVAENSFVTELFYNSGALAEGRMGIVTVGDGVIKYQNVRFE